VRGWDFPSVIQNKTNRGSGHRKEFVMSALNSHDDDFINECAEHFHKQADASFMDDLSSLADDNPENIVVLLKFILDPTSHLF